MTASGRCSCRPGRFGTDPGAIGERLARPQSFVSKVERGERRLDVVEFFEVARAIGIDPFAFLKTLQDADGSREAAPAVKIVQEVKLINCGKFAKIRRSGRRPGNGFTGAIKKVEWPTGSGKFAIYPESGKKRGMGNGVVPIKAGLMLDLKKQGYRLEVIAALSGNRKFGNSDAVFDTQLRPSRGRVGNRQYLFQSPVA